MVTAFLDDEEKHLDAMVSFIIANQLDDDLRRHDWRGFARVYNGPSYEANGYHTKMAAAYAKWAKIKDTPYDPAHTIEPPKAPEPAPQATPTPTEPQKGNGIAKALGALIGALITAGVLKWEDILKSLGF